VIQITPDVLHITRKFGLEVGITNGKPGIGRNCRAPLAAGHLNTQHDDGKDLF
jgi:hypothetical protein